MKINSCPACSGAAAIRYRHEGGRPVFRVWVQCELCGMRTREFADLQDPGPDSTGGKFAVIAWNSGDYRQEATISLQEGRG